jgi:mannose-6-phosphate isomerase-like protein (cupin superfamily)
MQKHINQRYIIEKPWGRFEQFVKNEPVTVKIITVNPNECLSLQYHHKREEFWKILSGRAELILGDAIMQANEGDEFFIEKEQKHRIKAYDMQVKMLEISFGDFDEEDIVRLEDKYQRNK